MLCIVFYAAVFCVIEDSRLTVNRMSPSLTLQQFCTCSDANGSCQKHVHCTFNTGKACNFAIYQALLLCYMLLLTYVLNS